MGAGEILCGNAKRTIKGNFVPVFASGRNADQDLAYLAAYMVTGDETFVHGLNHFSGLGES